MDDRTLVEVFLAEVVDGIGGDRVATLTPDPVRAAEIVGTLSPIARRVDRTVSSVAVNGRRVDVGVNAPGQEWRVVCSIDADGVHSASSFQRPACFAGIEGGRAVVVNGPSSAGKSSAMAAVVRQAATPWVAFDELSFGTVAAPYLIWPETAPTLAPGFVAGITALALAGNQVITTGGPPAMFEPLRDAVPTLVVGLDCPLTVRVDRQARRPDRWGGLTEDSDDAHDGWTYDLRFDTSRLPAEDIAARILERLDR